MGTRGSFARGCCERSHTASRRKDCGCEDPSRTRCGRPPADAGRGAARARGRGRLRDRPRGLRRQPSSPAVRETAPDVVLLDLRMPELDGSRRASSGCSKHDPTVAVVILSSYSDPEQIEAARQRRRPRLRRQDGRARRSGAVLRTALSEHVVHGLGSGGGRGRAPVRSDRPERARDRRPRCRGARALEPEIGRQLWISEQTVKFHLRNVYRKLGISSRTEAARYAYRTGRVAALTVESA